MDDLKREAESIVPLFDALRTEYASPAARQARGALEMPDTGGDEAEAGR